MAKLTPRYLARAFARAPASSISAATSAANHGFVNTPAFRGSTVLYPDVETMRTRNQRYTYGTHGTPTTDALCEAWSDLAGAAGAVLVPSGLFAIIAALTTALGAGDHLLMTDAAYQPARHFCDTAAAPDGRRDHLLRSGGRRRHRGADPPEHAARSSSRRRARSRSTCRTCRRSRRPRMSAASA